MPRAPYFLYLVVDFVGHGPAYGLIVAVVFEGQLDLCSVGLYFSFFQLHIQLDHLGNPEGSEAFGSRLHGRLSSLLGARVGRDGEIPVHEPDLVPVGLQELIQRFVTETLAESSLVVAELYDRDRGVRRPQSGVIVGADGAHHRRRRGRRTWRGLGYG